MTQRTGLWAVARTTFIAQMLGLALVPLMLTSGKSNAQANGELVLEEVMVVARKREESLQDVSVAVSAVTAQAIDDAHIRNSAELVQLVPSLTLGQGGGDSFTIRGIGTQAFSAGVEPSVSTMIDGVVLGRSNQSFLQLVDIQRVEVLRGPQGTLFGKNSTGGVVHFLTRNPSEELEGTLRGSVIDRDEYRFDGTVSGPVTENLGLRLTYGGIRDDGYIDNVYNGDKLNGGDTDTVRFKARWLPGDTLELKWSSDYSQEDDGNRVGTLREVQDPEIIEEIKPVVPSKDNYSVNLDAPFEKDLETWGHSLEANWDIGEYVLTSISAYRKFENDNVSDVDDRPTSPAGFSQFGGQEQDQYSQELRIASPVSGRLRYVTGLYYFYQDQDRYLARELVSASTGEVQNSRADFSVENTNIAAFGELTWDFAEGLRGVAGGRYTYDDLEYDFERSGSPWPVVAPFNDGDDDTDFSPKLALEWDALEDAMTYLSYVEGYKGQAYNVAFGITPPLDAVEPETSKAWELGFKSRLWDQRLMLNAALFFTEYEDFHGQTQVDDGENTAFFLTNAGKVETMGLEVDFTALVTERLSMNGGFALIDATIEDFPSGPCSQGQKFNGDCPGGSQDLSGTDLPNSPDWKVILNASYRIPIDPWAMDLVLKASYRGQDDVLMDITQDEGTIQSSYNIFDLAATMESTDGHWDVTAYVKNVTDKDYTTNIASNQITFNPGGYTQRLPKTSRRTAGFEVRYSWF